MSSSLWEDIKKTVKDGVTIAAEKTEEYTKIGKIKVEILNIGRNIDKSFTELGRIVFDHFDRGNKENLSNQQKLLDLIQKIKDQKAVLKKKEAEIEKIKKEAAAKVEKKPAKKAGDTGLKTAGTVKDSGKTNVKKASVKKSSSRSTQKK